MSGFSTLRARVKARLPPALVFSLLGSALASVSIAQTIATDGDVPSSMGATGTSETPAVYIIGNSGSYAKAFTGSTIQVGPFQFTPAYTQLTVQNGSTATFQTSADFFLWAPATSLTVTGAGTSLLLNSEFGNDEFGFSGLTSTGTTKVLEVLDGGLVNTNVMRVLGASLITIDGTDSTVYVKTELNFGNSPTLSVDLSNGGEFDILGFGNDTATINTTIGSGSTLRVRGDFNANRLNTFSFESGGTLAVEGSLTNLDPIISGQTVDLSGGGSLGTTTTLNGGTLNADAFSATNLTFTSGTLEVTGTLSDLNTLGSGQTVVIDGGNWAPTGNIDDGNLSLTNAGTVTLSTAFDGSNFTFTSGTLATSSTLTDFPTISSGRAVDLTGGGSFSNAATLDGGQLDVAGFDMANLTFTSGTINATGTLSNLNTLGSGQTVEIDGGSWAPAGNIDDGNLTLTNAGTVTLSTAFNGSNFTFTSGTLATSSTLTDFPTTSSGRTVDLTGGGSFSNAATLDGGQLDVATTDLANLTFTSGTINATGNLSGLNTLGAGRTIILDGGTWSPSGDINSGNLILQSGGTASVAGGFDGSNLTLTNGSLSIAGNVSNLPIITTGNTVTLTGGGTLQTATTLNGGTLTGADFDLDGNLTFSSGTLNVTGTLQNLTSLASGSTVNVSGSGASLILDQSLNITGGSLNITDGGSVTATDTLTLGAGALAFDSSGGTLDLDDGVLNVASLSTALALNSNTGITGSGRIFGDLNLGTGGTIDGDAAAGGLEIFGDVSGTGTLSDVVLYGDLSIGNSPGHVDISDTTLAPGSTTYMEIFGTGEGQYDTLFGNAGTDVSGANLSISLSSYVVQPGDSWPLFSGSFDPTSWASISIPAGTTLSGYTLSAVPEPGTNALLAGLGVLGLACYRRRKSAGLLRDRPS